MQSTIKIETHVAPTKVHVDIFGLNIFASNQVPTRSIDDPRVAFLRRVTEMHKCSIHTGNLIDLADTPEELFGCQQKTNPFSEVKVGIKYGAFYAASELPSFAGCFFPVVDGETFWLTQEASHENSLVEIIEWDAMALYVGVSQNAIERMRLLLDMPFQGNEEWLGSVLSIYGVVILTSGDGSYFTVQARDTENMDKIIAIAAEMDVMVMSSSWYRANISKLQWDNELSLCLKLSNS